MAFSLVFSPEYPCLQEISAIDGAHSPIEAVYSGSRAMGDSPSSDSARLRAGARQVQARFPIAILYRSIETIDLIYGAAPAIFRVTQSSGFDSRREPAAGSALRKFYAQVDGEGEEDEIVRVHGVWLRLRPGTG